MSSSTITGQIRKIALQILDNNPQGVHYSELSRKILEQGNLIRIPLVVLHESFNPLYLKNSQIRVKPNTILYNTIILKNKIYEK